MSKVYLALLAAVLALSIAAMPVLAGPPRGAGKQAASEAVVKEFVEEVFIDYADDTHAGPGPHPTAETSRFHLTQGGIRWFSGGTVYYAISNAPSSPAEAAVEEAEATMDGFVTTRDFARNDTSPSSNPCGGENSVSWTYIDGSGGVLAVARVCRNVATKEIGGFRVIFDSGDSWGTEPAKYDVRNVGTHEFIHVAGLGHVNAPKDGCLTMYRYAGAGETQKRTLGWGDKLGMDALYATGDTDPGPGCGS